MPAWSPLEGGIRCQHDELVGIEAARSGARVERLAVTNRPRYTFRAKAVIADPEIRFEFVALRASSSAFS
jgi:hypothetical protein